MGSGRVGCDAAAAAVGNPLLRRCISCSWQVSRLQSISLLARAVGDGVGHVHVNIMTPCQGIVLNVWLAKPCYYLTCGDYIYTCRKIKVL
jgi:hypothetical protein